MTASLEPVAPLGGPGRLPGTGRSVGSGQRTPDEWDIGPTPFGSGRAEDGA